MECDEVTAMGELAFPLQDGEGEGEGTDDEYSDDDDVSWKVKTKPTIIIIQSIMREVPPPIPGPASRRQMPGGRGGVKTRDDRYLLQDDQSGAHY